MLGPIGSNLINILKVLTPAEIESYSNEGVIGESRQVGKTAFALAAGAENLSRDQGNFKSLHEMKEEKAKILPFKKDTDSNKDDDGSKKDPYAYKAEPVKDDTDTEIEEEQEQPLESKLSSGGTELESIGILSSKKIKEIQQEHQRKQEATKDSATLFLLKQRKKLQSSKTKLTEQTALENYNKILSEKSFAKEYDEVEEKVVEEEITKGVLVNKKSY